MGDLFPIFGGFPKSIGGTPIPGRAQFGEGGGISQILGMSQFGEVPQFWGISQFQNRPNFGGFVPRILQELSPKFYRIYPKFSGLPQFQDEPNLGRREGNIPDFWGGVPIPNSRTTPILGEFSPVFRELLSPISREFPPIFREFSPISGAIPIPRSPQGQRGGGPGGGGGSRSSRPRCQGPRVAMATPLPGARVAPETARGCCGWGGGLIRD